MGQDHERRHGSDAVRQMLLYLDRMIDAMSEAVLVIDRDGSVVAVNQAAVDLLDLEDERAALRPLADYHQLIQGWRIGDQDFAPGNLQESLEGKPIPRRLATITTLAGQEKIMEFTGAPLRDEGDRVVMAMMVARDVTDDQRLRAEMREVNQRLLASGLREQALAQEAERQTAQLNALMENQTEGVIVAESTGRIVLVNRVGREMCGWPEGMVPRTVEDYRRLDLRRLDGTPLPFDEWPINRALRGERFTDQETILVWPSGEERRLLCSGSAVQQAGWKTLAITVYRDVTELRRLEQAKGEYISIISHDLRTPLTALMGFVQLLGMQLAKKGLGREAGIAEKALESARKMNSMIQDLADSARLESGKLELAKEPTNLNSLVKDIVERAGPPEDQHRLQVETTEGIPKLSLDPNRFERALVNLISNALKYSPADRPVVVRVERRDGEAIVSVIDQGAGIPPEEVSHLFERYYRTKKTRKTEGLGLGLYITRQIVDAHGGRVWVESEQGKGSKFRVAVPLSIGA